MESKPNLKLIYSQDTEPKKSGYDLVEQEYHRLFPDNGPAFLGKKSLQLVTDKNSEHLSSPVGYEQDIKNKQALDWLARNAELMLDKAGVNSFNEPYNFTNAGMYDVVLISRKDPDRQFGPNAELTKVSLHYYDTTSDEDFVFISQEYRIIKSARGILRVLYSETHNEDIHIKNALCYPEQVLALIKVIDDISTGH